MLRLTRVHEDQMVTGHLEFYHLNTPVSIVPTVDGNDPDQRYAYYEQERVWERVINVIRSRSNPVIIGPLMDSGFSFAVEHGDVISVTRMQEDIRKIGEADFADGNTVDLSGVELLRQSHFVLAAAVPEFTGDTVASGDPEDLEFGNEDSPGETATSAAMKTLTIDSGST